MNYSSIANSLTLDGSVNWYLYIIKLRKLLQKENQKNSAVAKRAVQHTSEGPNKHTLKFPSANNRNLLQPAQKCSVIDVINEIVPTCPSILKFFAVSVG
jgi:hypothetical protein